MWTLECELRSIYWNECEHFLKANLDQSEIDLSLVDLVVWIAGNVHILICVFPCMSNYLVYVFHINFFWTQILESQLQYTDIVWLIVHTRSHLYCVYLCCSRTNIITSLPNVVQTVEGGMFQYHTILTTVLSQPSLRFDKSPAVSSGILLLIPVSACKLFEIKQHSLSKTGTPDGS